MTTEQYVDITPTPRILRVLGDIPFDTWQCLAELADNSLDALRAAETKGTPVHDARIDIHWTRDVASKDRAITVQDNGNGMPLDVLQEAARAGYSGNDPIGHLGLFGMGFNISTARLGDETVFLSTVKGQDEWTGIRINFDELQTQENYKAPVITEKKENPEDSGTKIVVSKLKEGIFLELDNKKKRIRQRLERIYSPILQDRDVEVYFQGNLLKPIKHCRWNKSRFVTRRGNKIAAFQEIDRDLGSDLFDVERNRYLTEDEKDQIQTGSKGNTLPDGIEERSRRLLGWIGIQRYSHPNDFGIDFIRNGRKILLGDKAIFGYENPETGVDVSEYPLELGSTTGGRIVGELHVDYLIPTYQKNGFDTSSRSWRLTLEAIRGAGPLVAKSRKALGFDGGNESPLGVLVNAYRRFDPGTKNLAIANQMAKEFGEEFRKGTPEYQSDDKWYKAAQEADKVRSEGGGSGGPVDEGETSSDDPDEFGPGTTGPEAPDSPVDPDDTPKTSDRDALIQTSKKIEGLTHKYAWDPKYPAYSVKAWDTDGTSITVENKRVPYHTHLDGIKVDFFYDHTHPVLSDYSLTPKQLLLLALADKFSVRDPASSQETFMGLVDRHLGDERINEPLLKERANATLNAIREDLPRLLAHRMDEVFRVIDSIPAEREEVAKTLLHESPVLFDAFQNKSEEESDILGYVGNATIARLIAELPEEFLDGKVFDRPYRSIDMGDDGATKRLQEESVERVESYVKDVCGLLAERHHRLSKYEMMRLANTLSLLEAMRAF